MQTYFKRHIKKSIDSYLRDYPSVMLTGARQVGKTSIFENEYNYKIISLDNINILESIKNDAVGAISSYDKPLVIDEVQREQSVFNSLKYLIDKDKKNGEYLLIGSQKFELMKNVSESLSGRIGILQLLGLSNRELNSEEFYDEFIPTKEYLLNRKPKNSFNQKKIWENIQRGSFPKLYDEIDFDFERFYSNYIDTYVERDVRSILNVTNLYTFIQFMTVLASRTGQVLNMNDIAKDIGINVGTVKKWLSVLETSNLIYFLQPFSLNVNKRIIKSPKVYFTDTGIVCYLCKWLTAETLKTGAMAGQIFETYVVSEILKSYYNAGKKPNMFYFRNTDAQEVDLIFYENGKIYPIEIKATNKADVRITKGFKVLSTYFPNVEMASGGIICTEEELIPLGNDKYIIPVDYI